MIRNFVLFGEIFLRMLAKPVGHLCELFAKTVDRLHIHICLSNQLGEGDFEMLVCDLMIKKEAYQGGDTSVLLHMYPRQPFQPGHPY